MTMMELRKTVEHFIYLTCVTMDSYWIFIGYIGFSCSHILGRDIMSWFV